MRPVHPFRIAFQIAVALAALVLALPAEAAAARSTVQVQAQAPAADQDAAYQRLVDAANAIVQVKTKALPNARSNATLGQERTGSGALIRGNLILTIGYLVLEAESVEVTDADGATMPAAVVAYDHATGFGLLRPLREIAQKPIPMGTASPVTQLDRLMIVNGGEEQAVSIATVVSKRKFAGYWEYMIENAIFTAPPRLDHSGAALVNQRGELVGIGSLFVMDALAPGERLPGNMFVPVDLVKPIIDEMVKTGSQQAGRRPWLGVNSLEEDGRVKVLQVNEGSPAAQAGLQAGDIILAINGQPIESLEGFYTQLWSGGPAGVDIVLTVLHGPTPRDVTVRSIDRREFMRRRPSI